VAAALRLVGELNPDLVIIDISLKTGHGIDLIKQSASAIPR
jgi:DNA-binding NarL/FixJ family response regulator